MKGNPLMQEIVGKLRQGWYPEQIAGRLRSMLQTALNGNAALRQGERRVSP